MNISLQQPLWKTNLSDEDYKELKELIKENFTGYRTVDPSLLNKYTALYYASWWRREYSGGIPTREAIAESLGLKNQWRAVYDVAKAGLNQLRIRPIKGLQNKLWLRTMLVQGGLPMACIASNQDQFNGFRDFLGKLIEFTSTYTVSWDNSDFISELPFLYKLPKSFQNEGIYELCLQIAKAINEGDDNLLPFDTKEKKWNEITQELKTIKSKDKKENVNLSIKWFINNTDQIKLFFLVELPKLIPISYLQSKEIVANSFQLYASEKQLATYDRYNDEYYVLRQRNSQLIEWKNEPVINVVVRNNAGRLQPISLPNNIPPDFSVPTLAVHTSGYLTVQSNLSSSLLNTVLYDPTTWVVTSPISDQTKNTIRHFGARALAAIDTKEEIELVNLRSEEIVTFSCKGSNYNCEFVYTVVDWMSQTNVTVIKRSPKIYVYNEDGSKVSSSDYEVVYRQPNNIDSKWEKYHHTILLPLGKIEFRVTYPDKKKITSKFYNVGGLNFSVLESNGSSCKLEFNEEPSFVINPVTNQEGIRCLERNSRKFEFNRNDQGTYFPSHIEFAIAHNSGNLHFKVVAPFKGMSIYDSEKNIQTSEPICLSGLYHYHLLSIGESLVCKLYHSLNPGSVFTYRMQDGAHCLTQFESGIQRLLQLNESSIDNITSYIRMECQFGSQKKLVKIKEYNLNVAIDPDSKGISVLTDSGKLVDQFVEISCIDLLASESGAIVSIKLSKDSNSYVLPESAKETSAFLLFSESHCSDKIPPTVITTNCSEFNYESGEHYSKTIEAIEAASANTELWLTIVRLFDIASSYNIPFNTFEQFKIIAKSPILLVKMAYSIWCLSRNGSDTIKEQLLRFENEMGAAFHWIKNDIWDSCFNDWFIAQYSLPDSLVIIAEFGRMLMRERMNYINFSLKSDAAFNTITNPYISTQSTIDGSFINGIRQLMEEEKNLIDCKIEIPNEWIGNVIPIAFNFGKQSFVPNFKQIKTLLLSPFKSSLSASGKDDSLWDQFSEQEITKMRRAILFYRAFRPDLYYQIFENTFVNINHLNS